MMKKWKISKIFLALLCTFVLSGIGCSKGCKSALRDLLAKKEAKAPTKDQQEILSTPPAEKSEKEELAGEEDKTKDLDVESLEDEENSEEIPSEKESEEIPSPDSETRQPDEGGGGTGIEGEPGGEKEGEPTGGEVEEKPEKEGEPEDRGATPDSDTFVTELYEIILESAQVPDYLDTFKVALNTFFDRSNATGFGGYDVEIHYDPLMVTYNNCVGPSGELFNPLADQPPYDTGVCVTVPPVGYDCVKLICVEGPVPGAKGFFNLGWLTFNRVATAPAKTVIDVILLDYIDSLGVRPTQPVMDVDSEIEIVALLPPEITAVDNDGAKPYDNIVASGFPSKWQIYGSNFMWATVVGCITPCSCLDGEPDGELEICLDDNSVTLGFSAGSLVSDTRIDTTWYIKGPGGPFNLYVENPDGQRDNWGPATRDPGVTINP